MRVLLLTAALLAATSLTTVASAQAQRGGGRQTPETERDKKAKSDWETPQARLDRRANAGPCPFVKVLYDAARYVELEGGREAPTAVKWAGEIQGIDADCSYRETQPITVDMDVTFNLGRGPRADGQTKTYRYWVAVTERNRAVIAKEYFTLNARFEPGQDRLTATERLGGITIPRKDITTSGSNFEVLIGFDVTPEMAQFNRDGKRFRATAGQAVAQAGQTAAQ